MTTATSIRFAYHNGGFVDSSSVALPLSTQGLHYGTGVFEGIRAYRQDGGGLALFRLPEHLERFRRSAQAIRIELPLNTPDLTETVLGLVRRNDCEHDTYIRPLAYKLALEPGTAFGVRLTGVSAQTSITTVTMGAYVPGTGIRCLVSRYRRIPHDCVPAGAKITGTYVNNALAVDEAQSAGCDDALMLDGDGNLTEAGTSNVFVVTSQGQVATPPANSPILPGITRASVIELLERELRIVVDERPVSVAELASAREVFLTGTGVEVCPVTEVDHRAVGLGGVGPITARIQQVYTNVVRGRLPRYAHWLTGVSR